LFEIARGLLGGVLVDDGGNQAETFSNAVRAAVES
jgi:hypothetical protein